jgi:hypothetical protein
LLSTLTDGNVDQVLLLDDKEFLDVKSKIIENNFTWVSSVSSFSPIYQNYDEWAAEIDRSSSNFLQECVSDANDLKIITFGMLVCFTKFAKKEIRNILSLTKTKSSSYEQERKASTNLSLAKGTQSAPVVSNHGAISAASSSIEDTAPQSLSQGSTSNAGPAASNSPAGPEVSNAATRSAAPPKSIEADFIAFGSAQKKSNGQQKKKLDIDLNNIVTEPRSRAK